MENIVKKIVEELFLKIKDLPNGYEISTAELYGFENYMKLEQDVQFNVYYQLIEKCKKENIVLNFDKYAGTFCGLPFNIPFIIEK